MEEIENKIEELISRAVKRKNELEETAQKLKLEAEAAAVNSYEQSKRVSKIHHQYNAFKELVERSDLDNKIVCRYRRDLDCLVNTVIYQNMDLLNRYDYYGLPEEYITRLRSLIDDFSNLEDSKDIHSICESLVEKMLKRQLTEEEYNRVMDGTHPKLIEYFEFKQQSEARLQRYRSLPSVLKPFYYHSRLHPYDKDLLRKEKKENKSRERRKDEMWKIRNRT